MSYSNARNYANHAAAEARNNRNETAAIEALANAISQLSTAIETDMQQIKRDLQRVEHKVK